MTIDDREMTDEELAVHTEAIKDCIGILLACADNLNADRDSYMKAATAQLNTMAEVCTFTQFDLNSR